MRLTDDTQNVYNALVAQIGQEALESALSIRLAHWRHSDAVRAQTDVSFVPQTESQRFAQVVNDLFRKHNSDPGAIRSNTI